MVTLAFRTAAHPPDDIPEEEAAPGALTGV
jgi:hypothetical protein